MATKNTRSIVVGDRIKWTETVWGGGHRRPRAMGKRTIVAVVLRESYGAKTGQHTFSLDVWGGSGLDAPRPGAKIRRKGRSLYRDDHLEILDRADNYVERMEEKHERGAHAKTEAWYRKSRSAVSCAYWTLRADLAADADLPRPKQ